MEQIYCLDSAPTFLGYFDPSIAPSLLYYAYIPILVTALGLGLVVFFNRQNFRLPNILFFLITVFFSLYILNEILMWIAVPAGLVHFGWQMTAFYLTTIALIVVYFTLTMLRQHDIFLYEKIILFLTLTPVLLLLPTKINMGDFNLWWCESLTGPVYFYIYSLMVILALYMITIGITEYRKNKPRFTFPLVIGSGLFILLLSGFDLFGLLVGDYEFNLISPIGMIVFIIAIAYLIVRFEAFNVKLIAAQALVAGLIILIGSQIFFVESTINTVLVSITFVLSCIGGFLLVRSVKKEVKQREELEVLTKKLEKANAKLKVLDKLKSEFVSIASHQLRSPLTSIRGYASMLLEGSYGSLSQKAHDAVSRIAESSRMMALSVEDYLNVSRIQAGNMKYELADFNVVEMASNIADDIRQEAVRKGLVLSFKSDMNGQGIVHADKGKTMQIIHNLVNNALKYTPKGTITVFAHDEKKKVFIDIVDTGIGLSQESIGNLFGKFERAQNANEVNISGTGLGLYVAQKMAREMGGDIEAFSEGEGKGSTFRITLPMQM